MDLKGFERSASSPSQTFGYPNISLNALARKANPFEIADDAETVGQICSLKFGK